MIGANGHAMTNDLMTDDSMTKKAWYVIHTKPLREEQVGSFLSMKGLEILNPLLETYTVRDGRVDRALKPLFLGYVLGKFSLEQDYSLVRWARGVKRVLGIGGWPVPVAEEVVAVIRERVDPGGIVRYSDDFQPNQRVRIKSGPLKDLMAIFQRWMPDRERVKILLSVIGYQPVVELHYSMLERAV